MVLVEIWMVMSLLVVMVVLMITMVMVVVTGRDGGGACRGDGGCIVVMAVV